MPKFCDPSLHWLNRYSANNWAASNIAEWTQPQGGYFISLNTLPGLARQVVAFAAEAGVTLTAAGATYPLGLDPEDRNIRIAPSFPDLQELQTAITVLTLAIKLASARLLAKTSHKEGLH